MFYKRTQQIILIKSKYYNTMVPNNGFEETWIPTLLDSNIWGVCAGQGISLIGHSAGGWLARVYMEEFGFDGIALLLTLGSPHSYTFPLISCVVYPLIASLLGPSEIRRNALWKELFKEGAISLFIWNLLYSFKSELLFWGLEAQNFMLLVIQNVGFWKVSA